jgi:putative oxidoreductase
MEFAIWSPRMLSVLRIMAALLFIQHGTQKFFGFPPPASPGEPSKGVIWAMKLFVTSLSCHAT